MTKVKIKSLVDLNSIDYDVLSVLLVGLTLNEISQSDGFLVITILEDLNQTAVNAVILNMKNYLLQNLITGEII